MKLNTVFGILLGAILAIITLLYWIFTNEPEDYDHKYYKL